MARPDIIEGIERIKEKLKAPIAELGDLLSSYVSEAPDRHQEAVARAYLDDVDDPDGAIWDGGIQTPIEPVIRHDSSATAAGFRQLFRTAVDQGVPLRMLEYRFSRSESGWAYSVTLETKDAYRKLAEEREAIDQEIYEAMLQAAGEGWERIGFEQRKPGPPRLLAMRVLEGKRDRHEVPVTPELEKLLQRTDKLHSDYGRDLIYPRWSLDKIRRGYEKEANIYY
ncbi:hypothetical protein J19TS2_00280 [Cohnella xylanilytica]|uniref:hypothetical protein n=1 Tax=Cohnella xylanilytica TaxID=557555 RepID=UPI001B2B5DF4|nr:hypothetical protein [Cohnella xylanilytica]GIO10473.1 hypothetical protein J19TS2_00280 [Cohnella xylanilytica]